MVHLINVIDTLCFFQQVELMPGTGVYIKRATYNQLQFIDKGSKLVRKLVREIFPDVHLLASSSCMGKGESSAGLDRHKVEVIKGMYALSHKTSAGIQTQKPRGYM